MKEYRVQFIKIHEYRIKANSAEEATNKAFIKDEEEQDLDWLLDPVDEINTEELGEVKE